MRKIKYLLILTGLILGLSSCHKIETLSPIPSIEFTNFTVFDTTDILDNHSKGGRLRFRFQDGDGDLGLAAPSGSQSDSTNLFFTLFRKVNGVMVEAANNDPLAPSDYRIPYMFRVGQNKILKGTISITFLYLFYSPTDTIRYDFYVRDRNFHKSNVASTSEIVLSDNKTYY